MIKTIRTNDWASPVFANAGTASAPVTVHALLPLIPILIPLLILMLNSAAAAQPVSPRSASGGDKYEPDDNYRKSGVIIINEAARRHNFHDTGDEDWVKFLGLKGKMYFIKTNKPGPRCNTVIELYDTDGRQLLDPNPTYVTPYGVAENVQWLCARESIYYIRARQLEPDVFGEGTGYGLSLWEGVAPFDGKVMGKVTDAQSGASIPNVTAKLLDGQDHACDSFVTDVEGQYRLLAAPGIYRLLATASGFETYGTEVEVKELQTITRDFAMVPEPGGRADLVIPLVSGPAHALRGSQIEVIVKVRNLGDALAARFKVAVYLSRDTRIELGPDRLVKAFWLPGLATAEISKQKISVAIPTDIDPGTYYLGAMADTTREVAESRENNNTRASETPILVQ